MGVGTLTIYSASAGSGKTHKLASIYLEKLFRSRFSYRKILAVTFTHKATSEMKERILEELRKLAAGEDSTFLEGLKTSTGKTGEEIRKEAGVILFSILHDFSRFSVSTIDSFYQKIIRAFSRDIGLHSGFNIEIDSSQILSSAVDRMIDSASTDMTVRNWLRLYARSNIEVGKSWDLKKSIIALAGQLFTEKFKLLSGEEKEKVLNKECLKSYRLKLTKIMTDFNDRMREAGLKCQRIYQDFGLSEEMFYQKGKGIPAFISSLADGEIKVPNSYVRNAITDPAKWSTGKKSDQLIKALEAGLEELIKDIVSYFDTNYTLYRTAQVILSNIFILGIFTDVLGQVRNITNEENIFLLSDAGELIYLITRNDQAPFIYEKTGNAYENFMIDEFQDTSVIQWKNFQVLIENSMAEGYDNLVVGDIKQSIYRWRNSDWETLMDLNKKVDGKRYLSQILKKNWRSCPNIIRFNNSLFSVIPYQIDKEISENHPSPYFTELYSEILQEDPGRKKEGYVRIEFVGNSPESDWQEKVLKKLPSIIESLQDKGFRPSDIGILVRDNKEGAMVMKQILDYSASITEEKKKRYNYNIVSSESLLLINSPAINFIMATLRVIANSGDMIGKALMLRSYLLATGKPDVENIPLNSEDLLEYSSRLFPEGYEGFLDEIKFLPLWDLTENIIRFFGLGDHSINVPYINRFQDVIVRYTSSRNPGLSSFLEWWETQGAKESIILPEQKDSINVLTIHKSKGLEFSVVLLPFISWNLDHVAYQRNILWVIPDIPPFNTLGIVPVHYRKDLSETIFSDQYFKEKYAAYLDNINLLYVAFTRAVNVIIGFAPDKPRADNRIASILKEAICFREDIPGKSDIFLYNYYNEQDNLFEYGTIPELEPAKKISDILEVSNYPVNDNSHKFRLKLHWENYLIADNSGTRARINYGKIMHEVFSEIRSSVDVTAAVRRKVLEGKITENDEPGLTGKINTMIKKPVVSDWFDGTGTVLAEKTILLPDSMTKRPDRIVINNGKVVIIDFKFGEESPHYISQILQYKNIIKLMGYEMVEAYLWYVDADKIVNV